MPTYDYKCRGCDHRFDVIHGMNEEIVVQCPECGGISKKIPSLPRIGQGSTKFGRRMRDAIKSEAAMKEDLRVNYGVEQICADGRSLAEVYNDVKAHGSFVKERMAQEEEKNQSWRDKNRKERHRTAPQRIPKREAIARDNFRRKAAERRAIRLSSG